MLNLSFENKKKIKKIQGQFHLSFQFTLYHLRINCLFQHIEKVDLTILSQLIHLPFQFDPLLFAICNILAAGYTQENHHSPGKSINKDDSINFQNQRKVRERGLRPTNLTRKIFYCMDNAC